MIIDQITIHLRGSAPAFEGRVFQAAEFYQINKESKPCYPSAYVLPPVISGIAIPDGGTEASDGYPTESYPIITLLSAQADQLGQGSLAQLPEIERQITKALYGWKANGEYGQMVPRGSTFLYTDQARYFHKFEYGVAKYIRLDCDGISDDDQNSWMELGGKGSVRLRQIRTLLSSPTVFIATDMDLAKFLNGCPDDVDPCAHVKKSLNLES